MRFSITLRRRRLSSESLSPPGVHPIRRRGLFGGLRRCRRCRRLVWRWNDFVNLKGRLVSRMCLACVIEWFKAGQPGAGAFAYAASEGNP